MYLNLNPHFHFTGKKIKTPEKSNIMMNFIKLKKQ